MSQFISKNSGAGSYPSLVPVNDERLHDVMDVHPTGGFKSYSTNKNMGRFNRTDTLWPRSRIAGANIDDLVNSFAPIWDNASLMWRWRVRYNGTHTRKIVSGVTKDSTGTPIAGVTVELFNTASDERVDTVVSDAAGNYAAGDPNSANCFAVGYLAGAPDRAGTTRNDLTGV